MSWPGGPPPPPFPQPFAYPGSSAHRTTSTTRNRSRLPDGSPLESVRPPQHLPQPGVHSTTHSYTQPSQPPPVHRTTHPHYNPSVHAPAPPLTHSYSSSPYPSSQLPSGLPPLSPSMMHRATTFPIPGQEHYVDSARYQNISAPGIAQASHAEMQMPGAERQVSGGWSHHDAPIDNSSEDEGCERGRQATGDRRGYERDRSPTNTPFSGGRRTSRTRRPRTEAQVVQHRCRLCGYLTPVDEYDRLGGFCSEIHRWQGGQTQQPFTPHAIK